MYELRAISSFCSHLAARNASETGVQNIIIVVKPSALPSSTSAHGASVATVASTTTTTTAIDLKSYSIYGFRRLPGTLANAWRTLPAHGSAPIDVGLYPLLYWLVLVMSVCALWLTVTEFTRVLHGRPMTRLYRTLNQSPAYFTAKTRRRVRLCTAACMSVVIGALVAGIAAQLPRLMHGWLGLQAAAVLTEIVLWLVDLWHAEVAFSLRTLVTFVLVYVYWLAVWTLRQTFVALDVAHVRHGVSLLGS